MEKMERLMKNPGYRRVFTAAEKTESVKAIGRAFGKPSSSIYFQTAPHGGIRPAPRRRSRLALTLSRNARRCPGDRDASIGPIDDQVLGHSPSTVSREFSRNGGYDRYRASQAEEQAWARSRRLKRCKLADSPWLRDPGGCLYQSSSLSRYDADFHAQRVSIKLYWREENRGSK
jgi:hypothetical protein